MFYEQLVRPVRTAVSESEFMSHFSEVKRCFVEKSKGQYSFCLLVDGHELCLETNSRQLFRRYYRQVQEAGIPISRRGSYQRCSFTVLAISVTLLVLAYLLQSTV